MGEAVYDVIVVGAGNAGLSAALAAHQAGTKVLILDKCPKSGRGGNTRFSSGGFRFIYHSIDDIRPMLPEVSEAEAAKLEVGTYASSDYYQDVMRVTEYAADKKLTKILVDESYATVRWLSEMNVKWVLSTRTAHAVRIGEKIRFPSGRVVSVKDGGIGLVETLFGTAQNRNIDIIYEAKATGFLTDKKGKIAGVRVQTKEGFKDFEGRAVVLASGGFEANPEMRAKYLGPGWETVKVRGCRYNSGETLNLALGLGAQAAGQWSGCHAALVNAEAPEVEAAHDQMYSYPYGIMVDINGQRFTDEGADFYTHTYGKLGREVLRLPWRTAFQIFDSKVKHLLRSEYSRHSCVSADSVEALGRKFPGLNWDNLVRTVKEFNEAVQDNPFEPAKKDGKGTKGISPVKSNWAQRLDSPPFYAYPVTCGITFTFGGIRISEKAEVVDTEGNIIRGLFAAGEITGGSFYENYPGGSALMKGAVFGRIAGVSAASASKSSKS
ncbi:MAG: FAD-dependent tricarballylate dehydrogenase TcuA [Deltaproteobacteria bacterium]|nr:FAD-dependent tricarballylate dehydrogenase TcuA [Deltaproteobacteria bacterium]